MSAGDMDVVTQLRDALAASLGAERFALWFAGENRFALEGDTLHVRVPDRMSQGLLRRTFHGELQAACRTIAGRPLSVVFCIDETLQPQKADAGGERSQREADIAAGNSGPSQSPGAAQLQLCCVAEDSTDPRPARQQHQRSVNAPAKPDRRSRRKFATLDEFVVGPGSELAHHVAELAAMQPGASTPLLFCGPPGVGKTHLLEAIWSEARRRHPRLHAVYMTSEEFTTLFIDALRSHVLPTFRRKYRGSDLLIIDDLQFFCGKNATIGELQHTLDTLVADGKQLVLSADRPLDELGDLGREIVSRIKGGIVCQLELPEQPVRETLVRRFAESIELALPDPVVELIAQNMPTSARELQGAVGRLKLASAAWRRPVDTALAQEALTETFGLARRVVSVPEITQAVCEVFGVGADVLVGKRNSKSLDEPRALAMFLARKWTGAAYSEIGRHFGNRRHSTVIAAQRRVNQRLQNGAQLALGGRACSVADVVRSVETRLRIG